MTRVTRNDWDDWDNYRLLTEIIGMLGMTRQDKTSLIYSANTTYKNTRFRGSG